MKRIIFWIGRFVLVCITVREIIYLKEEKKKNAELQIMSDKHLGLFLMMNQWVKVRQEGKNLVSYFEAANINKIAIYGMNYVGETLVEELKGTKVSVAYGIDKNAEKIYSDIDVVAPDASLREVDAIIVTAISHFEEIRKKLKKIVPYNIISLEDVLYEI